MTVPLSADVERLRRARQLWELELDLQDVLRVPDLAEYMLANMGPLEFYQQSPLPGDARYFSGVYLQLWKQPTDVVTKCRLLLAISKTGVVAKTPHGWLYMRDAAPPVLRAATDDDVADLPRLPDNWEEYAVWSKTVPPTWKPGMRGLRSRVHQGTPVGHPR
jgi:hypothetical protein